jgi:hypothetical protein
VAAGFFDTAGGVPANNIARWDGIAWSPLGAGIGGQYVEVHALTALPNGDLVAGGFFSTAGNVAAANVARWNGTAWSPLGAGIAGGWQQYPQVHALAALPNGDVLAGGSFDAAGGVAATNLARWNGSAWSAAGAVVGLGSEVFALAALSTGEIVVGGGFTSANGRASHYAALYTSDCLATAVSSGAGCAGSAGPNVLTAETRPWTGSTFTATATGLPANALALVVYGLSPAAIPLTTFLPQAGAGCSLLTTPDAYSFALPTAGTLATRLTIPSSVAFAGVVLFEQVGVAELGAQNTILAVTSTNALQLTIGSL